MKYLLRKCEIFADANVGKFHFTLRPAGAIFHNSRSELFHIRRKPNISLSFSHKAKIVDRFEPPHLKCLQNCGIIRHNQMKGGRNMDFKILIRRFFAFVIDWNIMFGIARALMFYGPGSNPEYLLYPSIKMFASAGFLMGLAWLPLYCLFKDCLFGRRSLGKLICGLMIQNSETGEKASFGSLILRNITYVIVQIEGIVVLVNKGKRLGDSLAKTQVVRKTKNT